MVVFNLYPWREPLLVHQRRKMIILLIISFLITSMIMGLLHELLQHKINREFHQIETLDHQLSPFVAFKKWETQQKKNTAWVASADKIRQNNLHLFALLQAMNKIELTQACLTGLTYSNNELWLTGKAMSAERLMSFIRQWPATRFFAEIKVASLVFDDTAQQLNFKLQAIAVK